MTKYAADSKNIRCCFEKQVHYNYNEVNEFLQNTLSSNKTGLNRNRNIEENILNKSVI